MTRHSSETMGKWSVADLVKARACVESSLRSAMKASDLNISQIARGAGIPRGHLSRFYNGHPGHLGMKSLARLEGFLEARP